MNTIIASEEKEGLRLSLKEMLGKQFDSFLKDYVCKSIEEAAYSGLIDVFTLKRINKLLKKKGNRIFDVPITQLAYATKNTLEGGELFEVKLPIAKDLTINTFVKIFPAKESYARAVYFQEMVDSLAKGNDLEKIIVPAAYRNDKLNLVAYPLINANSIAEILSSMDAEQKEGVLRRAIAAYQEFSLELTMNKGFFSDDKGDSAIDQLMSTNLSFSKFFFERLDQLGMRKQRVANANKARSELEMVISDNFSLLDSSNKYVIHPDLNPGNILLEKDSAKIIDFEKLSMGFQEFAYGKLLTKAGVGPETEERLVRWAASNQAKLEGRSASQEEISESVKRYELNRISQELLTAVRYLKRVHDLKDEAFRSMADVSYTLAIRRARSAEEKRILSPDFRRMIEAYNGMMAESLKEIPDSDERLMDQYNPHIRGSQENMAIVHTLDLMLKDTSDDEISKELCQLRKNIATPMRKGLLRKIAYATIPLLILAGAGLYIQQQTVEKQNASIASLVRNKKIDGNLASLRMLRKKSFDNSETLLEQYLYYCEQTLGEETGRLFFVNPDICYEAMVATKSKDYDVLSRYVEEKHRDFFFTVTDSIKRRGYTDNWAYRDWEKNAKTNFDNHMAEAKIKYEAKHPAKH